MPESDRRVALNALHDELRACRRCLGAGHPVTTGAVFSGPADARLMVVGQAPGVRETEILTPFSGPSGRRLFSWFAEAGWDELAFRATQYMTAITKCFPGKAAGGRGDRVPSVEERRLCGPYLDREIEIVDPEVIVSVGGLAIRRFLGTRTLRECIGRRFDIAGRVVIPLPHPSGANLWLNRRENQQLVEEALEQLRRLDL